MLSSTTLQIFTHNGYALQVFNSAFTTMHMAVIIIFFCIDEANGKKQIEDARN